MKHAKDYCKLYFMLGLVSSLIALMLGCAGGGTEGTYGRSFAGTVLAPNGAPIANAEVEILEVGVTTRTNGAGVFAIDSVQLPGTSASFRVTSPGVEAVASLDQELPAADVVVSLDIRVQNSMAAEVQNVQVQIIATPTPRPAATSAPTATPAPQATSTPTSAPSQGSQTPTPGPTAQSTPTPVDTPQPSPTPSPTPNTCPGDVNGDRQVNITDLSTLLSVFGLTSQDPGFLPAADLDHDNDVDQADLGILQANYGTVCS